uniref:Ribonuclease H-like domain-containing protein n=1 Tax=Tanacetum cinerariifolium TaxID=118510 RepID=A0A6L2NHQ6_TANCI|nr:ribonuclease H-like domain-containing protein [Tanacetum cinerariifolium]
MNDLLDDNNFFIFDDVNVRISPVSKMPFRKNPRDFMNIVQICLWIIDSGCSKHMMGNRALLTNFVEKFLETVRFGNNDFAIIAGYGDVVIGLMTINKVYYVIGLGYNLFSVGEFCDKGLEVAFQKSTCFVRNEDGVDLLTGDRSSNLYTIALNEVASNSSTCLLAKASSLQSWLKLKEKEDIGVFVGYSKESAAFRIYNKQTHKIHESVNVNFNEISEMASKQFSLEPGLSNLNEMGKSSNPSVSQVLETSKKDLEDLLHNFYDEYFDSSKIMKSSTTNVKTSISEEVFHEVSKLFQGKSSSSSLNDDVQKIPTPMVEQAKLKLGLVGKPVDHTDYRSMIGSLMYVTLSIPDIMFATYADHAGCHLDKKSTSGSVHFLGDKLECWSSKKQNCVSISTAESKYVAVSSCCAQVLWMCTQLTDYGFFYDKRIKFALFSRAPFTLLASYSLLPHFLIKVNYMLGLLDIHWSLLHSNDQTSLYCFQAFHCDAIMGQINALGTSYFAVAHFGGVPDCYSELRRIMPVTRQGANDAMTQESIQAMINRAIQRKSTHTQEDASQNSSGGPRRPVQPARVCSYTDFMKCQPLNFRGTKGIVSFSHWVEKIESIFHISSCAVENQVKFAACTMLDAALTWWNGHVRTLGHDDVYAMTWETFKKRLTDKYCPKGEIKKLDIELRNLNVKGNDVGGYTQRFQELALMCTKLLSNETEKVDKYISGLSDNIHGNVMSA